MPDPTAGTVPERTTSELLALKVVDLVTYAVTLLAVVAVPVGAFEVTAIGGLVFTKWVLFFFGGAVGVYASLQLRPASPKRRQAELGEGPSGTTVGNEELSWLQRTAAALPPARWTNLQVRERFSPHAKLFAGGVLMIATSWLMEAALGIGFL
jgi:hypothetical protein